MKQWRIDSVDQSNHISWYLSLFIASARLVTISCWLLVFVSSNYICRTLWSYRFPFCETIIKLTLHTTHKHSGKKILEKIYNKSSTFCHIIWLFVERHETFSFTHRDLGDGGHITTRTHEQSHKKKKNGWTTTTSTTNAPHNVVVEMAGRQIGRQLRYERGHAIAYIRLRLHSTARPPFSVSSNEGENRKKKCGLQWKDNVNTKFRDEMTCPYLELAFYTIQAIQTHK